MQCMQREVWEEIGFHPSEDSQSMADYIRSTGNSASASSTVPQWMVWQQEEDADMASFLLCDYGFSVSTLFPSYQAYIEAHRPSSDPSPNLADSLLLPSHDLSYPDHLSADPHITSAGSTDTVLATALESLRIEGSSATEARKGTVTTTSKEVKSGKKHKKTAKKDKKMGSALEEPASSDEA